MQTASVSDLRRRLGEGGLAALTGLIPESPAPGPESTEADAYESLSAGRPGAAFLMLRAASIEWRDAGELEEAEQCEEAAVALFRQAFPPHADDHDATGDLADWLIARLDLERAVTLARAELRAPPAPGALSDVEERRHRWFCRLLAGRNIGRRYALDELCTRHALGPHEHAWLAALYAVYRDRAVVAAAARLPGETGSRLTAGLLADCLAETPRGARDYLVLLAPGGPLRSLGLVTVDAPWPLAPIGHGLVSLTDTAALAIERRPG